MAGFSNITSDESIMFADNASFDGTERGGALTTNGQLWIGATALPHVRKNTLTAGTGVSIANGPGAITISASATTPLSFPTDSGTATPASNQLTIAGTHNVNTAGSGSTVTVAGNNAITLGDLSAIAANSNAMSATTGDVNVAAGNIKLPNTNAALTQGVIKWGTDIRVHNFGTDNIFMGNTAGNGTLTGTDNIAIGLNGLSVLTGGTGNVGVGANALRNISSANSNTALGVAALNLATTSANNTALGNNAVNKVTTGSGGNTGVGYQSLRNLDTGSFCTALGYQAGNAYTTTESNNICIGNGVTGTIGESGTTRIGGSQTACYIDGIDGVNVGSVATVVTESGDRLGTAVITAGTGVGVTPGANTITISASATTPLSFPTDSGTATPAANALSILGGPGVTTSGSGSTVTINSVVFTDTAATTLAVDNGYNATAAGTYNMPATAAQGELIIVFCDTAGAVVLDCPANNFIRIGSLITSSGGTATSTLQGDSLTLRYRLSTLTWEATSVVGTWLVA